MNCSTPAVLEMLHKTPHSRSWIVYFSPLPQAVVVALQALSNTGNRGMQSQDSNDLGMRPSSRALGRGSQRPLRH